MPRAPRAIVLLILTGCAAVPADRQPAVPPALLPLSRLFANPEAWRTAIRHYTEVESFLADCLGGRRAGSS